MGLLTLHLTFCHHHCCHLRPSSYLAVQVLLALRVLVVLVVVTAALQAQELVMVATQVTVALRVVVLLSECLRAGSALVRMKLEIVAGGKSVNVGSASTTTVIVI